MSRTRTPRDKPEPRHRYRAVLTGSRLPATPYEAALSHLLDGADLTPDAKYAVDGVEAALRTYDLEKARDLFDACLLARAPSEEIEAAFHVAPDELDAYAHLFFDIDVFPNDFHVQAYIAEQPDGPRRAVLQEGFVKGFGALRTKYAGAQVLTPEQALQQMFTRDAQLYVAAQDIPLGDKRIKEVRALGKQLLTAAALVDKVSAPKETVTASGSVEFVIQSGPKNPTLDELMDRGVEIVR